MIILITENAYNLSQCIDRDLPYILIDGAYRI